MTLTCGSALSPEGRLRLVIFDCDGVLVDSEATSCRIVAEAAREAGLDVPDEAAVARFAGRALSSIQTDIEEAIGSSLGENWCLTIQDRFVQAFGHGVDLVDGAHAMLDGVINLGLPVRVGSNSSMAEMDVKFRVTGLYDRLEGRIHSARDMKKPKPDPDVYLYAAALEGVTPAECVVLEDSDTGARAALAAGMTCVLLRPAQESAPYEDNLIRIETLKEFQPILENVLFSQKLKTT